MKLLKRLFIQILLIGTLLVLFYFKGSSLLNPLFASVQQISSHLKPISSVEKLELQGATLTQEFLFPYDFISAKKVNWPLISLKAQRNTPLSEEEQELYDFFDQCLKAGLDLSRYPQTFFVVAVRASAGYELSPSFYTLDNIHKKVTINLPQASVLNLEILDGQTLNKNWPDPAIDPQTWQQLMLFLQPKISQLVKNSLLLKNAEENNKKILYKAFHEAGFTDIIING